MILGLLVAGYAHADAIRCTVRSFETDKQGKMEQDGFSPNQISDLTHTQKTRHDGREVYIDLDDVRSGLFKSVNIDFDRKHEDGYLHLEVTFTGEDSKNPLGYNVVLTQSSRSNRHQVKAVANSVFGGAPITIDLPGDEKYIHGIVSCSYEN